MASTLWADDDVTASRWMESQKSQLWQGQLRQVIRAIRQLCPRSEPLPDKIRTGVGYLFNHRHRLRYQQFRQAGYPLGIGTVESACKLVMHKNA